MCACVYAASSVKTSTLMRPKEKRLPSRAMQSLINQVGGYKVQHNNNDFFSLLLLISCCHCLCLCACVAGKKLSDLERVTSLKVYNWFANRRKDIKRRANIGNVYFSVISEAASAHSFLRVLKCRPSLDCIY